MFISYPHARFLSTFEGNKLNRGHLRRQSTRSGAIAHRDGGIIHGGDRIGRTRGCLGPFTAQVNPTGGSPGGPPTLPPIGPSCAGRGYHYQSRGPRAQSRIGGYLGPFMRRLTPQVVAQAGRPHCHLSGPAAQERVTTTSKGAHANIPRPARRITGLMYRRCPHEDESRCHHLLYRLSRTRKPKSRATSNTQCPITRRSRR